jgi:membrane protease YdiL (CAAX protease family)
MAVLEPHPTSQRPCRPGYWCTAGLEIECLKDYYNAHSHASNATACVPCPEHTETVGPNSTSATACICVDGYYLDNGGGDEDESDASSSCALCPLGAQCDARGLSLHTLPLAPGYYRRSNDTSDVRACPDSVYGSMSGCEGGASADPCRDGLSGLYCRECLADGHFYVAATTSAQADCEPCSATSGATAAAVAALLTCALLALLLPKYLQRRQVAPRTMALAAKAGAALKTNWAPIKTTIGFYQIACQVPSIYRVMLPPSSARLLSAFKVLVTLGIGGIGTPLQCLGWGGFRTRLNFFLATPVLLVMLASAACVARARGSVGPSASPGSVVRRGMLDALPAIVKILFFSCPLVFNVAFEAFACEGFGPEGAPTSPSFLLGDYTVVCKSASGATPPEYAAIRAKAVLGILLFPVAIPLSYALLLWHARTAITQARPTSLSRALAFLHADYEPRYFMWELMEVLRRFLLVGVACVVPPAPGSVTQLVFGATVSITFLVIQAQTQPYKRITDDFVALASSIALVTLFLCCVVVKTGTLTEEAAVRQILPPALRDQFDAPAALLSVVLFASVVGSIGMTSVIAVSQYREERRREHERREMAERDAQLRRLRNAADGSAVNSLPRMPDAGFHLFLSHVWGTGQDQMRVIKQRLREMLPGVSVFLDVDDLEEIGDLEGYVDRSSAILVFCSPGYFSSRNCMREIRCAVTKAKPLIALLEDPSRGGWDVNGVRGQLVAADASYDKWGFAADGVLGEGLADALFAREPIEWNRIGAFQDVTMRLIAERLLPDGHRPTYVEGEAAYGVEGRGARGVEGGAAQGAEGQETVISGKPWSLLLTTFVKSDAPRPSAGKADEKPAKGGGGDTARLLYVSVLNPGTLEVLDEVRECHMPPPPFEVTQDVGSLGSCDQMVLGLNGLTWTRGEQSGALAHEVVLAMRAGVDVILVHEMPGIGQEGRHPVEFGTFFSCVDGATPSHLLKAGIYDKIAVALKGGAWRKASMALLAKELQVAPTHKPVDVTEPGERRATLAAVQVDVLADVKAASGQLRGSLPGRAGWSKTVPVEADAEEGRSAASSPTIARDNVRRARGSLLVSRGV